jgi:hypothetical protein
MMTTTYHFRSHLFDTCALPCITTLVLCTALHHTHPPLLTCFLRLSVYVTTVVAFSPIYRSCLDCVMLPAAAACPPSPCPQHWSEFVCSGVGQRAGATAALQAASFSLPSPLLPRHPVAV